MTNQALGQLVGLSHSSVSRLRSGERGTSVAVMLKIEEVFGWDLRDQIARRDDGSYAGKLADVVAEYQARALVG